MNKLLKIAFWLTISIGVSISIGNMAFVNTGEMNSTVTNNFKGGK